MHDSLANRPPQIMENNYRRYVIEQGKPYWSKDSDSIERLPIPSIDRSRWQPSAPQLVYIDLPPWALDLGVDGQIMIPAEALIGKRLEWKRVDWFYAAFWYLSGKAENDHEAEHGPIHSYCTRLKGWPHAMWDHAWSNRIFLFLRRYAVNSGIVADQARLGTLPRPRLVLTHDVDAIAKTAAIRFKQTGFIIFNGLRNIQNGQFRQGWQKLTPGADQLFQEG